MQLIDLLSYHLFFDYLRQQYPYGTSLRLHPPHTQIFAKEVSFRNMEGIRVRKAYELAAKATGIIWKSGDDDFGGQNYGERGEKP